MICEMKPTHGEGVQIGISFGLIDGLCKNELHRIKQTLKIEFFKLHCSLI